MRKDLFIVAVLVVLLYAALAFGIYTSLTQYVLGANDFFSRWMGARALFLRGENPYSDTVTREIQMAMYGRLARADEDQVAYAYPLYTAFAIAPLVVLPYAQAEALWLAFLIFAVIGGVLALIRLNEISMRPAILAVFIIGALMFYPAARGIFNGQFALVSFVCLASAMLAIQSHHDALAGILLALATLKPQPGVLIIPVVIVWASAHRRWQIVALTVIGIVVLIVAGLFMVPTWLGDFVLALRNYAGYLRVGPPVQTLGELLVPQFSMPLTFAASFVLLTGLLWTLARSVHQAWQPFQSTIGLAALVTTLMAGRVGTPDQILLLFLWLAWFGEWRRNRQNRFLALGAGAILFLPWLVFFATLNGDAEHIVVTLVLPLLTLGAYGWRAGVKQWTP
jgi:hypothetical protein